MGQSGPRPAYSQRYPYRTLRLGAMDLVACLRPPKEAGTRLGITRRVSTPNVLRKPGVHFPGTNKPEL